MFRMEFKRTIRSKIFIYIVAITLAVFLLGYILPVGIDKQSSLSYSDYLFSTYTVMTQFGFLLYSFVISIFFNKDYTNKTILFYKNFEINYFNFYLFKVILLFLEITFSLFVCLGTVSIFYDNYQPFIPNVLLFSAVSFQYIIIISIISFLFSNVLISLGVSIIYWLTSMIFVSFGSFFKYIALFDASNFLYPQIDRFFKTGILSLDNIVTILIFLVSIFLISFFILFLSRKRWEKLGI
ncbi:ABC transporter permease [Melissococcus plutonius]|uniref:Peptide ABC transporter permease n=2 Tax=Melissococcus plutonius TaxID=33970 RepID=F3Y8T3_MELPT|nr:ABC transporter permease [Melissococcus plutonius]KMT30850.1 putative peptide export permease protein YydJ [Melissococcus plutonius]KMT35475.1 putative peptide export permease protein YydJ [Melissococcus plutonius]KMT41214.1 putative peptide export permease protein YydJ [Melissococcus plutonius]MBB5178081.1 putative peptide transport system permease protein [Melissococcus plutonius]BAK20911.1 conserved hypothetical protein [Melissococcus plutonius ATCC 35311]